MSRTMIRAILRLGIRAVIPALAVSGIAFAHDFWVQPSTWRARAGERISVELRVGHPGDSDSVARDPRLFRGFFARRSGQPVTADSEVVGVDGRSPAGYARPKEAGSWRIAYESEPRWLELEAAKFERYLAQEGLEEIVRERAALGESASPGREFYSRCAVALLHVRGDSRPEGSPRAEPSEADGSHRPSAFESPLGLPLEIVPDHDPMALEAGDALSLRILRRGLPLEGVLLCLDPLVPDPELSRQARSDARGRVTFELPAPGGWLVTAVAMERAPREVRDRPDRPADWVSHWASLSFEAQAETERVEVGAAEK